MINCLVAFARTGDPSTAATPWPQWTPKAETYFEFGINRACDRKTSSVCSSTRRPTSRPGLRLRLGIERKLQLQTSWRSRHLGVDHRDRDLRATAGRRQRHRPCRAWAGSSPGVLGRAQRIRSPVEEPCAICLRGFAVHTVFRPAGVDIERHTKSRADVEEFLPSKWSSRNGRIPPKPDLDSSGHPRAWRSTWRLRSGGFLDPKRRRRAAEFASGAACVGARCDPAPILILWRSVVLAATRPTGVETPRE